MQKTSADFSSLFLEKNMIQTSVHEQIADLRNVPVQIHGDLSSFFISYSNREEHTQAKEAKLEGAGFAFQQFIFVTTKGGEKTVKNVLLSIFLSAAVPAISSKAECDYTLKSSD